MVSIEFKPAKDEDAEPLVNCQIAAFHHDSVLYPAVELGGPPGYDSVAVMLEKISQHDCYKMVSGDQIIGGMVIFVNGGGHYHLDVIFIHPNFQNQGIGTQAMQFMERSYPAATKWTLDTPQWAVRNRHFYEKFGYNMVEEYEFDGFPLVAYAK